MAFDSCQGVVGRWLIYETMPRYMPPRVTYRYTNEPWQVVSPADDYRIVPVYDPTRYYRLEISSYKRDGICGYANDTLLRTIYYPYNQFKGGSWSFGIVRSLEETNPYNNDGIWKANQIGLRTPEGWVETTFYCIYEGCKIKDDIYNSYSRSWPWVSRVDPIDGAPINYRFDVYYKQNLVYQETRNIQPEAEILPESCEYHNEDKKFVRDYYNTSRYAWMSEIVDSNCVHILANINHGIPPESYIIPISLYYKCSDCDLPPKIDTECIPDCLKCPQGTCPIPCGNVMCCYNSEGVSVVTIPIDRYCDQ